MIIAPKFPNGYVDYMINHERLPGIGPLAGWRGNGKNFGKGKINPNQINEYIKNGCFYNHEFSSDQSYYKFANKSYIDFAYELGGFKKDQIILQIYSEEMQKFKLAAEGLAHKQPPKHMI